MNKVLVGLLLGGLLGIFDGVTAWFTPAVRAGIIGIVIGSCIKGMIAGVAAGWFARKVQSVVAGLVFGLAVGLLLAWLVAFMQHGYYFEIMLPGGIVGAIVGWATQRYGRPSTAAVASAMMLVVALCTLSVRAAEGTDNVIAADAFGRLKTLAGRWNTHVMTPDGPATNVDYRVTGGGTVVMETLFAGAPHEMITMYTLDGDNLVATHYCAIGNQPTMKLDLAASTRDNLIFQFVAVHGQHADGDHIHDGRIHFLASGDVQADWNSTASEPKRFFLNRAK
jgi:hypothetical protein